VLVCTCCRTGCTYSVAVDGAQQKESMHMRLAELERDLPLVRAFFAADDSYAGEAIILDEMGQILISLGDVDAAIASFEKAAEIFQRLSWFDASVCEVRTRCSLGEAYMSSGKYRDAIQSFEQARASIDALGDCKDYDLEAQVSVGLGTARLAQVMHRRLESSWAKLRDGK